MKIIQVIPNLRSGGAEKFVVDLSNELANKEYVKLYLVTYYDISENDIFANTVSKNVKLCSLSKKSGLDFQIIYRLFKLIKEVKPDIVHSHINSFFYLFPIMLMLGKKISFFHTIHNDAYKEAGWFGRFLRKIAFSLKYCKAIAISHDSLRSFEEYYGYTIPLVYNGCSKYLPNNNDIVLKYRKTSGTKVLVNIGRIVEQKNQLMLLKVCRRLLDEGFDFVLLVIGRVGDRDLYEKMKDYFDNNRIIYVGEVSNPRDYLYNADYFCLSSIYEGMPISLLEAFSTGCVPICTPVGGNVNLIKHKKNGLLSKNTSEESYYIALKEALLLERDDYQLYKNEVKKAFDGFDMKSCANNYLTIYKHN